MQIVLKPLNHKLTIATDAIKKTFEHQATITPWLYDRLTQSRPTAKNGSNTVDPGK